MLMKPPTGTQSIIRALQILKMFDDTHPTWELQQLTDASGLNKTTLFRILGALEAEGLLERAEDGRYRLGSEMIALGGRAARTNNLRSVSHQHLRHLTEHTGETSTLEVLHADAQGWVMLVIDEVLGRYLVGAAQYIGSRLPIHATSTGKAVLAFTDEAARSRIVPQPLPQFTELTVRTAEELDAHLADVRRRGYAVAMGELERGLVAISAPIFDVDGAVRAALSLTGPSVRVRADAIESLAHIVIEQTRAISYQLGYRHGVLPSGG